MKNKSKGAETPLPPIKTETILQAQGYIVTTNEFGAIIKVVKKP